MTMPAVEHCTPCDALRELKEVIREHAKEQTELVRRMTDSINALTVAHAKAEVRLGIVYGAFGLGLAALATSIISALSARL